MMVSHSTRRWPASPPSGAEQQAEARRLDAEIEANLTRLGFEADIKGTR